MEEIACCCLCHCIYILILCFTAIALSLTINNTSNYEDPLCYIKEFYVPALDLSQDMISHSKTNYTQEINPCLFFYLTFYDINSESGVRYGDVNLTFSYGEHAVADYVVPSFDQGKMKTTYKRDVVESHRVPWENAVKAVSNGSTVVFRVDLAAGPKFKREFGLYSKKKDLRIGADVEVDGSGMKVKKNDIMLSYAASKHGVGIVVLLCLLFTLQCLFF